MTYLKAIEAGADIVDTAMSPFALGTSQPATEAIVATLNGTNYDTGIGLDELAEISMYFNHIKDKYIENKTLEPKVMGVNSDILLYQVPGGMLSNLVSQLKEQNALDKYEEVLKEIPKVRKDLGYPPLVTPTSQIVGTQAVFNVIMGQRYKMIPKETKGIVKGEYGKTPVEISQEVKENIIGDEEIIECRPADLIKPELDNIKNEIKKYIEQDEDVLTYALFPTIALEYFKMRQADKYGFDEDMIDLDNKIGILM
jgi:oxaloacetate decarboxylase alpha subunit